MEDLNLTINELKAQRDAAYEECKKLNRIVEQTGKDIRGLSQKQSIDRVSNEQMSVIVQNLVEKNSQLEKDLKIQILHGENVEGQFRELRKISELL